MTDVLTIIVITLAKFKSLLPLLIIPGLATVLAFIASYIYCRGMFRYKRGIKNIAIFFAIGNRGAIRLGISWTALWVLFVLAFTQRQLTLPEYYMLLMLVLSFALSSKGMKKIAGNLIAGLLEIASLVSVNFCRSFTALMPRLKAVYILLTTFTFIFGLYVFISGLDEISSERNFRLEGEREKLDAAS